MVKAVVAHLRNSPIRGPPATDSVEQNRGCVTPVSLLLGTHPTLCYTILSVTNMGAHSNVREGRLLARPMRGYDLY